MKILSSSNPCSREYCESKKKLTLFFYDKTHTGCQVIIYLARHIITITVFQHLNILKNADYTFNRSGFEQYVMPFLNPAEVEKQKSFDDFQHQQEILMANQREFEKQEKQKREDALEKAHNSNPQMCDPNTCVHCSIDRLYEWCQSRNLGTYT